MEQASVHVKVLLLLLLLPIITRVVSEASILRHSALSQLEEELEPGHPRNDTRAGPEVVAPPVRDEHDRVEATDQARPGVPDEREDERFYVFVCFNNPFSTFLCVCFISTFFVCFNINNPSSSMGAAAAVRQYSQKSGNGLRRALGNLPEDNDVGGGAFFNVLSGRGVETVRHGAELRSLEGATSVELYIFDGHDVRRVVEIRIVRAPQAGRSEQVGARC
jgi:hypothetical protein